MTTQDNTPQQLLKAIIFIALILFICLFLARCTTPQKAMDTLNKNPADAAKYCAEKFPVKDSIIFKTDTLTSFDTITLEAIEIDTLWKVYKDTLIMEVVKTLPPKVITKTVTQVKEVYRENTARVKSLELSIEACNNEVYEVREDNRVKADKIVDLRKDRNKWRLYFFILLIISIGWNFRKLIFKFI